jgi:hypothetical protein
MFWVSEIEHSSGLILAQNFDVTVFVSGNVPICASRGEHFGSVGIVSSTRSLAMSQILGLSLALLLFGGGIWANVSGGSLSQDRGAWVSHANR